MKFLNTEYRMWKQSQTSNDYNGLDIWKEYINEATKIGPSCADCLEIWQPQHPEMLRASTRITLPLPLRTLSVLLIYFTYAVTVTRQYVEN